MEEKDLIRVIEEAFGYGKMAWHIAQTTSATEARRFLDNCKQTILLNYYKNAMPRQSFDETKVGS